MIGGEKKKVLYVGSDHAGYNAKTKLKTYLEGKGFHVTDLGCFSEDPCDYPDIAREVAEKMLEDPSARGILICGSGIGVGIAANRFKKIRAVTAANVGLAEMGRKHNDANVLTMGARTTSDEEIEKITEKFLNTDFEGEERHERRRDKMDSLG